MMTRILKDHGLLSLLLVAVASVNLMVWRIVQVDLPDNVADMLASHWAFLTIGEFPLLFSIGSSVLLFFSGLMMRVMSIRYRLLESKGWLPVLVMVCLYLVFRHALLRPDVLVGMIIGQAVVFLLLSTYRRDAVLNTLFHVGMIAGFAAMFLGPALLLIPVVLFGVFILRPGSWREWVMPFVGLAMALVFAMMVHIWHVDPVESLRQNMLSAWVITISPLKPHVGHVIVLVLLGLALPAVFQDITSGAVQTRNGMLVLLFMLFISLLMGLGLGVGWTEAAAWGAFPAAVIISSMIERATRWWWADLLLLAVVVAAVLA